MRRIGAHALLVAIGLSACAAPPARDLDTIVRSLSEGRAVEGRIFGLRAHRPYRDSSARKSPLPSLSQAALAAVQRLSQGRVRAMEPDLRAAAGAELLVGRSDKAFALLLEALDRDPVSAAVWNDLAVAHLALAGEQAEPAEELTRALDAAERAVELAPNAAEGWFNLGLAASRLSLRREAQKAWLRATQLEPSGPWRDEVVARMRSADASPSQGPAASKPGEDSQTVEELLIDRVFVEWSRAFLAGRQDEAARTGAQAVSQAAALQRASGDGLMADCARAIERAFAKGPSDRIAAALARAHLALAAGRELYEADRRDEADQQFAIARDAFAATGSPCRGWVDVQAAMSRTAMGDASNALALAGSLIGFGRAHGYTSLLGRAEWLSGTALVGLGRLEDAFGAYKAAIAAYDQARYTEHRLFVRSTTADALRLMGETTLGWTYLGLPLRQLDDIGRVRRRYAVLLNASLFATDQQLLRAALAFQNGALDLAVERGVSNTIVEGLISRAELAIRIGQTALAASDLKEAARLLPAISAPAMREYQDAWLQRVSAELAALTTPVPAISRLEGIVPYFAQHEPAEVPAILLARGRAARSAGQLAVAEESFSRGLSAVERLSTGLESDQHRTSYLAASWDLYDESVDLQATMNVSASAWRLADAGRQRALGGQAPRSAAAQIGQISLPSGTVLLYFATLRDRLLVWMADSRGVRLKEMPIGSEALGLRTRAFRRLIESGADRAELDHLGKDLFRLLIEPAGDLPRGATILIAPDGALPGLPFAALIDPSTERYLIEDHPLVIVPSAQFLETGRVAAVPAPSTDRWRVVTIGNASPGDGSAPLPEARRELEDVAALYGTVTSLTGARATAEAVAAAARDADVIHFAGHARSNVAFPWLSSLLLTPDPQHPDGRLTVGEIGQWRLPRARLVVLSGCETAFGGGTRNPGVLGLSRPFLLAGARSVVGSLWEVDDRPTRVLMSAFHRAFKKVADPVLALQAAQLDLIRGPSGNQLPRDWAGFATVGR